LTSDLFSSKYSLYLELPKLKQIEKSVKGGPARPGPVLKVQRIKINPDAEGIGGRRRRGRQRMR